MSSLIALARFTVAKLNIAGEFVPQLGLRFLLAYEFWESGVEKFTGENWFADVMDMFPFPFNIIPVELSWFISTWAELIGAICLVIGLGTRFWVFSLIILDLVAWYTIHAHHGYNVCNNGFKLPLFYLIMFLPLFFTGPGKASVDYLIDKRFVTS